MIPIENSDLKELGESPLERAALRRIATLRLGCGRATDLFAAVAEEVGRVVDVPTVGIGRYEDDGTLTVCSTFPRDVPRFPLERGY